MEQALRKFDQVWTQDGSYLGQAHALYHRTEGINPQWRQYATYLHVVNFDIGEDFYIPTDFVGDRTEEGRVSLTVDEHEVEQRLWNRMPDFIPHRQADKEELEEEEEVASE